MSNTSSWIFVSQDSNNDNKGPKLGVVFISFAASVAIFFVILFGRCLLRRRWRHHRRITTASIPSDSPKPELAPSTIASLPTFAYQKAIDPTGNATSVLCAVCLGQAQEGEMVKLLPKCKHVFHVECIDMWLYSHSTCPLCRSDVVDSPKVVKKVEDGEASAPPELPV
ncbi:E3 ubiquitin-protein ligase ATL41 [Elaeis guineensis]|uniref:RING-type E3 ubiquitin transferase n=1 Tax=Elaeis guineensis var. tenera TaxID=51953 RepID=A0A6I9QX57_ELAGV|nr:E3 ubiquitin-protein ligase ATL41 [Elaeis guineensis]